MIGDKGCIPTVMVTVSDDDDALNNNSHNHNGILHSIGYENEDNNNISTSVVNNMNSTVTNSVDDNHNNCNNNVLCLSNGAINLDDIPISVLRSKCRDLLSKRLNSIKVILSEDGVPRDWRGVLHCIGLDDSGLHSKSDPMGDVLNLWWKEQKDRATLGQLQKILGTIDRWDVVDDTSDYFVEDSKAFLKEKAKQNQPKPIPDHQYTVDSGAKYCAESNVLTIDDATLAKQGLPPQQYDAFVLFADEDIHFATEIIEKMEDFGLRLCVKERDLIGGSFEHDAILRMITERCQRLIVVFSPAFFESSANSFFVSFAQAIGIEQQKRKIIPCMYEPCKLPPSLSFYFTLVYKRSNRYWNFWDKLRESIECIPSNKIVNNINNAIMPRITITEIDGPSLTIPSVQPQPQPQQAFIQHNTEIETPEPLPRKRKDKSASLKLQKLTKAPTKSTKSSSPTTPTGIKQFWPPSPKLRSQNTISSSMWTLTAVDNNNIYDMEIGRCRSTLSLNSPTSSPTTMEYKKTKWYKKLLSPNSGSTFKLSADSDSSLGMDKTRKKKKWYRKRFRSRSKNRESELAKEM